MTNLGMRAWLLREAGIVVPRRIGFNQRPELQPFNLVLQARLSVSDN